MSSLRRIAAMLVILLIPALCWSQGKVFTRKQRLADFSTKTTKVVLSGSALLDQVLSDEVRIRWRISPFEFCTVSEYEALKHDTSYYFLRLVQGDASGRRENGMIFLALSKAGPDDNWQSLDAGFEVVRVPFAPASASTGREIIYIPAFIDIIQTFVEDAMVTEGTAYLGLNATAGKNEFKAGKTVLIAAEDLASGIPEKYMAKRFSRKRLVLTDRHATDSSFLKSGPDVLAGVVLAPLDPEDGDYSYQMVISADTHELFYFDKHPCSTQEEVGFRRKDLNFISFHTR